MGIADKLLESYGAKDAEFTVVLPQGEELRFKNVTDYVEVKALSQRGRKFAKAHLAGRFGGNKDVEANATKDEDLATLSLIISELSIEPKFTVADVLKLSKRAAPLLSLISQAITGRLTLEAAVSETEELDELGED